MDTWRSCIAVSTIILSVGTPLRADARSADVAVRGILLVVLQGSGRNVTLVRIARRARKRRMRSFRYPHR